MLQEAAESAAGKNGVPKGHKGTKGIVMLPNHASWTEPEDKKKKKKGDEDDDEDEGSEMSSIRPRNLVSYSSQSERGPRSPAKRKKKEAWPPSGGDDEEEEEEISKHWLVGHVGTEGGAPTTTTAPTAAIGHRKNADSHRNFCERTPPSVEPILWWSFSKTRTRSRAWSFGRGICPICAAEVSRVRAG